MWASRAFSTEPRCSFDLGKLKEVPWATQGTATALRLGSGQNQAEGLSRVNQALQARHLSLGRGPRLAGTETLVLMALTPKSPQGGPTTSLRFP